MRIKGGAASPLRRVGFKAPPRGDEHPTTAKRSVGGEFTLKREEEVTAMGRKGGKKPKGGKPKPKPDSKKEK